MFFANISFAQRYDCRIVDDNWQSIRVAFDIPQPQINSVNYNGSEFSSVTIDGFIPSSEDGAPCLPIFSRLIEVPQCDGFEVRVSETEYDTISLSGNIIMPVQPSRSKSDTAKHPLVIDKKIYASDLFYGLSTAVVEKVGIARDRHLARFQFSPVRYNPMTGKLIVCRHAVVTVIYRNADESASMELFRRYYSPHFASGALVMNSLYPKSVSTAAPIRYLIVAHSSFNGQLNGFVEWKRRKGFITDIVYTGSTGVGTTTTSIAAYIKSQYTNATAANPAPTYLLIVGDHEQIPAFTGTTDADHITDLYYISWTSGDNIPDCYCGRFSAQDIAQLTPQIQKTLMYEQYTFADPSFLDRAVLIAGVDGGSSGDYGYTHADPAMDYAATHYVNSTNGFTQVMYYKNNTSIQPTAPGVSIASNSTSSSVIRGYYNQGAGWINYSAHGSATSWGNPSLTTTNVSSMTNSQKFGLMIGNCCLTNKFQVTSCLGEALLRKNNYCGAVGYIGGSNSTYWNEDFYWAVGLRSGIGATMSMAYNSTQLGAYDRLCHTHNEAYSQWAMSQASVMFVGNMAVQSSSSSRKLYYWEIYHLMGDPSVMPYLTQAPMMTVSTPTIITLGTSSIGIVAAPYAYIALTEANNHTLVVATYADANGNATLNLPTSLSVGSYELAASAQQYQTSFTPISVIQPSGKYPTVLKITPNDNIEAGMETETEVYVCNLGDSTAYNVTVTLTPADTNAIVFRLPNSQLSVCSTPLYFDSIPAGDTIIVMCRLSVDRNVVDGTVIPIVSMSSCTGLTQPIEGGQTISIVAPVITIDLSHSDMSVVPGGDATITAVVTNSGHAPLRASKMTLTSTTRQLTVGSSVSETTEPFTLAQGANASYSFSLHAGSQIPVGVVIPLTLSLSHFDSSSVEHIDIFVGENPLETFENNTFHTAGWSQGTYPWTITNSGAYDGTYCLRSIGSLTHSQTAETSVAISLTSADSVSFYYKVSSEANYDKFHFYIDNNELIVESGDGNWTRAAFLVPTGNHTLKFTYSKDVSVSNNSDCAFIDNIEFPHQTRNVVFSRIDLCAGDDYSIGGNTINTSEPIDSSIVLPGTHAASTVQIIDYSVHPTFITEQELVGCDTIIWLDHNYTSTTDANHLFESVYGCDSLVMCHLVVNHSAHETLIDTSYADSYQWNGETYTESGEYEQQFETTEGCDSIVTLLLTMLDTNHLSINTEYFAQNNQQLLYPNPSHGIINFRCPVNEVAIYDTKGRRIEGVSTPKIVTSAATTPKVQRLDLSHLPEGIYLIRIVSDEGNVSTHRVILKR